MTPKFDFAKYIGIPFVPRGRDFDGCDCWGVAYLFFLNELGIQLPEFDYDEKFDPKLLYSIFESEHKNWVPVEPGKQKPADILVLKSLNPHIGIVMDKRYMVHIQKGIDSMVEDYKMSGWKLRIIGIYRHAELT